MKYLPVVAMLLALVTVMGGMGRAGFEATGRMILTIGALLLFFLVFYLVVARAI